MSAVLRLATRRSALALAQSGMVGRALEAVEPGLRVELVHVVTEGDRVQDRSLAAIGGKGLFVKEVEEALLEGRADLAVHSMKDLPAEVAEGLVVAAIPARESAWDLLVTRDGRALSALCEGAVVGTSSRRRELQLKGQRGDLEVRMLRGNVDTRLRRLAEGDYDAVVLAEAGVRRLGLEVRAVTLEGLVIPAVGQGALALEVREGDAFARSVVGRLDDRRSRVEVTTERAVLRGLGASCVVPLGAHARWDAATRAMAFDGYLASEDGTRSARIAWVEEVADEAEGQGVGERMAGCLRAARRH